MRTGQGTSGRRGTASSQGRALLGVRVRCQGWRTVSPAAYLSDFGMHG